MENRLQVLEAERDLHKEVACELIKQIENKVQELLDMIICSQTGASILRSPYIRAYRDEANLYVDIGFRDSSNNDKVDFGSNFDFHYDIYKHEITVNHGTIGEWGINDIFQVGRIKTLMYIFEHYNEIVEELTNVIQLDDYFEAKNQQYTCEKEISEIKNKINAIKRDQLINSFKVDQIYKEQNFFNHVDDFKPVQYVVKSVSNLCVKMTDNNGVTKQFKKSDFADKLISGMFVLEENTEC